jgi:rhodanese-related sulfurtransferase
MSHSKKTMLTMEELHPEFKNLGPNDLILDVRTPHEFAEGRVPGSKNIPFDQIMAHAQELRKYTTVYLYCRAGSRSSAAYATLLALGLNNLICIDDGGFPDWEAQGFQVER